MQTTVRITSTAHVLLKDLARRSDSSMQAVLELALEEYRRKKFLDEVNLEYARLQGDASAWASHKKELATWDVTLADGLQRRLRPAKAHSGSPGRKRRAR